MHSNGRWGATLQPFGGAGGGIGLSFFGLPVDARSTSVRGAAAVLLCVFLVFLVGAIVGAKSLSGDRAGSVSHPKGGTRTLLENGDSGLFSGLLDSLVVLAVELVLSASVWLWMEICAT